MASKITINKNGPIQVQGEFELVDSNGQSYNLNGKTAVFLCRCGASTNKPFCDGKHKACNFESDVQATTL